MGFTEQLRILQAAEGSTALLALATVDLAHHTLPAVERTRIKEALLAAAVPHWSDRDFLAALLEVTPEEGGRLLSQLCALTVVEPFPARGEDALNVHEATRLALREHLRMTDAERWKVLSTRARAHVGQGPEPHARIEALYHLFAIDQPAAAAACEALEREFSSEAGPEVQHALALAVQELTFAGWLTGSAQVEALLAPLEVRNSRGEAAQLEAEARNVASLACIASHSSGIGRAKSLLGDILNTKGRLDDALAAFQEFLTISQRLTTTDPSNAGWQHDLAVAHSKIGDLAQAQGRLDDALAAFQESLTISQRLATTDPSNAGWQRDLAVAHHKFGRVYQDMGNEEEAQSGFRSAVETMERAVAMSPGNFGWEREFAALKSWLSSEET